MNSPFLRSAPFLAVTLLSAASSGQAALLAGWDFQGSSDAGGPVGTVISQPPTTPRDFAANAGVFQSTSNLYFDGTNGSSSFYVSTEAGNSLTELGALNSITANTAGTNLSTATGVGSLALFNRTAQGGIDGKSAVFKLSMVGYESLEFSVAVQRPASATNDYGVSLFTLSYSTDGTSYQPWGAIDTGFGTSVINQAYALPTALQSVNNAGLVYIKMTVSGSTAATPAGSVNSTRVDNIQFNAIPVPEPGGVLLLAGTAAMLGLRRTRR